MSVQLRVYLEEHGLFPEMQSAYRKFHSTETALIKVSNDLLLALDKGDEAVVVLLDFSSAFDTIDHVVALKRLQRTYGINELALQMLKTYLVGWTQIVKVNSSYSAPFSVQSGVPQGSVMGPLEFILYTGPLAEVIKSHQGVKHVMYADDTQLYVVIQHGKHDESLKRLSECVAEVKVWSSRNKLKLNESKTEILQVTSQFRQPTPLPNNCIVNDISPSTSVRDLGVVMDHELNLQKHINNTCRSAAFGICKIGKLRRFLDQANTERLVHAFVTTHLDYCNSLYVNLPQTHIAPLQRIQNTAARLVSRTKKSDHITPVLRSLHWLPMVQRIQFKVLTITYKVKHGLAPKYISELLVPKNPSRVLRSSSSIHLQFSPGPIPRTRYGSRAFAVAAPQLWNKLPLHIRSSPSLDTFKTRLKTHLMRSIRSSPSLDPFKTLLM